MVAPAGPRRHRRAGRRPQAAFLCRLALAALAEHPGRPAGSAGFLSRGLCGDGRLPVVQGLCRTMSDQGQRAGFPGPLPAALSPALPAFATRLPDRLAGIQHAAAVTPAGTLQRHHGQCLGGTPARKAHRHGRQPAARSQRLWRRAPALAGAAGHPGGAGRSGRRRTRPQRDPGAGQLHPILRERTTGRPDRIVRAPGLPGLAGTAAAQRQATACAGLPACLRARRHPQRPWPADAGRLRHPAGGAGPGDDAGLPAGIPEGGRHW